MRITGAGGGGAALSAADINVKTYGAKGDTRKVIDAVLTISSSTVTSATAVFTAADVGKIVYGVESTSGNLRLPRGTVVAVNSPTSITVSTTAIGTYSAIWLVLGTDDADAIRSAVAAAKAMVPAGKVVVPAGGYLFSKCLVDLVYGSVADSITFEGAGANATYFYLGSNYDITTTQANQGIFTRQLNAYRVRMCGFTVDGLLMTVATITTNYNAFVGSSSNGIYEDIRILNFRGVRAGFEVTASQVKVDKCHFEGSVNDAMFLNQCGVTVIDTYAGNSSVGWSVKTSGVNGTSNIGYYVRWIGGTVDESTAGGATITTSTDVTFLGAKIYSVVGAFAASVDGTSVARFVGGEIIPFNVGNRSGLRVLAGGKAYLSGGTRLGYSGTGYTFDNAGTIYDHGAQIDTARVIGNAPLTLITFQGVDVSPAQLTADQHNYSPGSLAEIVRLTTDASRTITGLMPLALTPTAGQAIQIVNVGATAVVLAHESALSTAANRIRTTTGVDLTLSADQEAVCRYDATTARWRCSKRA